MKDPCDRCPIPEACLGRRGWREFCDRMAADEPDPVWTLHVVERSKLGVSPPAIAVDYGANRGPDPPRRCC